MELFKDTHLTKLELLSNATTIDQALHYIRTKQATKPPLDNGKIRSTVNQPEQEQQSQEAEESSVF